MKYPLAAIVGNVALSIIAYNVLIAGTLSGLVVGSVLVFATFNSLNHIIANRESFISLVKLAIQSLKSDLRQRQLIEIEAEEIRNTIRQ